MRLIIVLVVALWPLAAVAVQPYQLTNNTLPANAQSIVRESDGATIPPDPRNADDQAYLAWLAAGNTPDPAPAVSPAPLTSIQVISTSTSALNGTYAIDPSSQQKVQAISLYVAVNGKFPAGQAQQAWPDTSGTVHLFPTTAAWQAFATAMGDFVAAIDLGQTPSQPVTIP